MDEDVLIVEPEEAIVGPEASFLVETITALASGVPVNETSEAGHTRLLSAAVHEYPRAAELLLEHHGADPNISDDEGYRPLHYTGDVRIVELLLKHGADANAQTDDGETPLMMLFRFAHVELVRVLLRNGASLSPRNDQGQTVLEFAKSKRELLEQFPGDWQETIDLLTAVEAAGSWKRYVREPVVQLLCLRHMCLAGRATAPPTLVRCFGAPPVPNAGKARTRARRVAAARPLPDEVFALILGFWHWRT